MEDFEQFETPSGAEPNAPAPMPESEMPDELDRNVRLLSPTRMVLRRFFRSKLSIIGLVMIVSLILFCWVGPLFFQAFGNYGDWDTSYAAPALEIRTDYSGKTKYSTDIITVTGENGEEYTFSQVIEDRKPINDLALPGGSHLLGTDQNGKDVFIRLMYGGRVSLTVSFMSVFLVTLFGIILGGVAGYFGGAVDNVIMRICDILMCLPGFPIMLIVATLFESWGIPTNYRIYLLMLFLSFISWTGTARLVRGQILSLREQEYMVAAEAMGFSTGRKIFKHLIPNVLPQLIVSMTLSLGSMILYESTLSYLNLGVPAPYAAWGSMINVSEEVFRDNFNVWFPPGVCIIIAVLGFNFIGDGLRDALDPKMKR